MTPSLPQFALATICLFGGPSAAIASTLESVTLPEMADRAELIFEGVVIAIDHRNSQVVDPGDANLPHTFVTFAIERAIKGESSDGSSITLRFTGGPNGKGRTLVVSGVPDFSVGDRDVLFVAKNGSSISPLVGSERGRLRVVRGELYNCQGADLWITRQGDFVPGDEKLDLTEPSYPLRPRTAETGETRHPYTPPEGAYRPSAEGLLEGLMAAIQDVVKPAAAHQTHPTPSADPNAPFRVAKHKRVQPPVDPRGKAIRKPMIRINGDDR